MEGQVVYLPEVPASLPEAALSLLLASTEASYMVIGLNGAFIMIASPEGRAGRRREENEEAQNLKLRYTHRVGRGRRFKLTSSSSCAFWAIRGLQGPHGSFRDVRIPGGLFSSSL